MKITKATYFKASDAEPFAFVLLEFTDGISEKFCDAKMYFLTQGLIPIQHGNPPPQVFHYEDGEAKTFSHLLKQPDAASALLAFTDENTDLTNGQVLYSCP